MASYDEGHQPQYATDQQQEYNDDTQYATSGQQHFEQQQYQEPPGHETTNRGSNDKMI